MEIEACIITMESRSGRSLRWQVKLFALLALSQVAWLLILCDSLQIDNMY
jgi:hypothetical protein